MSTYPTESKELPAKSEGFPGVPEELPPPPSNVCRLIYRSNVFIMPEEYPSFLAGPMKKHDCEDYVKKIEKEIAVSAKIFLIALIPLCLIIGGFIALFVVMKTYIIPIPVVGFVTLFLSLITANCIASNKAAKGQKKMEKTLEEINSKYYARGVKWTFNRFISNTGYVQYIDITVFNPDDANAPPKDGVVFETNIKGSPQAGNPVVQPPPESKDAYMSKEAYVSVDIQPENEKGSNSYASKEADVGGAYGEDPANLYGY